MNTSEMEKIEEPAKIQASTLTCQIHKGSQYQFFEVYEKRINQDAVCCKCVTKKNLRGVDLLSFEDLQTCEENAVFSNWPILEKREIMEEYYNKVTSIEEDLTPSQLVDDFFTNLEGQILSKITEYKKKILSRIDTLFTSRDQLIYSYSEVAHISHLKNLVKGFSEGQNNLSEFNSLLTKSKEKSKENQTFLDKNLQHYKQSELLLKFKEPSQYLEYILFFIEQIYANLVSIDKKQELNQLVSRQQQKEFDQKVDQIMQLIKNPTNYCTPTFVKQFENQLKIVIPVFSSNQFDQISDKNPLSSKLYQEDQISILNKQIDYYAKMGKLKISSLERRTEVESKFRLLEKYYQELVDINLVQRLVELKKIKDIKKKYNIIEDKTREIEFIKSTIDNISNDHQTIERIENAVTIQCTRHCYDYQSFFSQVIQPDKKYVIRIQFEPVQNSYRSYELYIGISLKSRIHTNFLTNSNLMFSNNSQNGFSLVEKGKNLYDQSIRHDAKMRIVEYQMCLKDKYFKIFDYPDSQNIILASEENLRSLDLTKEYMFGVQYNSIQTVKIQYFAEVLDFINPSNE